LKNNYFSSQKLPKLQSTSFWSQGILGVKVEKKFFAMIKGYISVLGAKKTFFQSGYGSSNFKFLFLGGLGIYPQNLISTRRMES
jgi:hypothetical protein